MQLNIQLTHIWTSESDPQQKAHENVTAVKLATRSLSR